jgi:DNA-directed RNA polymerase specialized sigma subunit
MTEPLQTPMMTMSTDDRLEPEYAEAYDAWSADPTPTNNAAMLKAIDPIIRKGVTANVGQGPNPLMQSRARQIALKSLGSYDRKRAKLQTHLMNNLQSLRRQDRQVSNVVRAPERVILDQRKLLEYEQELKDELGRDPTDAELMNRSGFSGKRLAKVRGWHPGAAEGTVEGMDVNLLSSLGVGPSQEAHDMWVQMVYDDLPPLDQKVMEYTLGLNGRKPLSNQEIAKKLGRSPGAISQRKKRIQEALNAEPELSPFLD